MAKLVAYFKNKSYPHNFTLCGIIKRERRNYGR